MVVIVALVAIGPKDLPKTLRKLGQLAGRLRRMASELRAQSGIDDVLRTEGLAEDINEIRKLARGELDHINRVARIDDPPPGPALAPAASAAAGGASSARAGTDDWARPEDFYVVREREYPRDGADGYGALPDNAIVYADALPRSPLARDPLYMVGDADAMLPPEATEPAPSTARVMTEPTSDEMTVIYDANTADFAKRASRVDEAEVTPVATPTGIESTEAEPTAEGASPASSATEAR